MTDAFGDTTAYPIQLLVYLRHISTAANPRLVGKDREITEALPNETKEIRKGIKNEI
jgi:hypothetical protein